MADHLHRWWSAAVLLLLGCSEPPATELPVAMPETPADLVLTNARIYTFTWSDPSPNGDPAPDAPYLPPAGQTGEAPGWRPDARALAIRGDRIVAVGSGEDMLRLVGESTRVLDLGGATMLPGFVESHGHYHELGEQDERVDVSDAASVSEMAEAMQPRLAAAAPGEWIIGSGWDEGAWADALPEHGALSAVSPENPVVLLGRRGFGLLANAVALEAAGITRATESPSGGEVVKDAADAPTGVLLNRARALVLDAIPPPSLARRKRRLLHGLDQMARAGYVAAHHAGVYADYLPAYESLDAEGRLPIRMELMLAARPENREVMERWVARGPTPPDESFLQVRAVKAYYDGSLGSRGAALLADYSDRPGHRGVSGREYGFPEDLVTGAIRAGFQVGVHAIGDAGNRAVLDYFERVFERVRSEDRGNRRPHRIEHAQVVHPEDLERFGELSVVASMQPCHAVEDSPWAEDRLGSERIRGAYAWRSLRRAGAALIFNSDLAGTDHDIFYGLHCALTRADRNGDPPGGWYPEEALTVEEAIRAWTVWPARTSGKGAVTGTLAPGRWADLTVISVDPFRAAATDPATLLSGRVLLTVVAGRVAHQSLSEEENL